MTQQEYWDNIGSKIVSAKSLEEINKIIEPLHPSDRFIVIRDHINHTMQHLIKAAKNTNDVEHYQVFQEMKYEAKKAYEHDHSPAKMIDVDKACTKIYGILLRMIGEQQQAINKLQSQIDTLNEKNGIKVEVEGDDVNKQEDVQGK